MTEQERVDKLKARMSRWQEYVDRPQADQPERQPQADTLPDVIDAVEVPRHQGRTVRHPESPQPGYPLEPIRGITQGTREAGANSSPPDPLTDLQEARIADLKVAIVREREQADRLAEEVKRAQTLHAATIYSHLAEEKERPVESRLTPLPILDTPPVFYGDTRRKTLAVLIALLLIITSVCTAVFLMTR